MASGDPVVQILEVMPPVTSAASYDTRASASTPNASIVVRDYDDTTIEYTDYLCRLQGYAGGGLTFYRPWSATTATSGAVVWQLAIRAFPDDAEDADVSHTYDYNGVTDTAASASGELSYPVITFTNGADMDNLANGEIFILRERRLANDAADTMTGDAEAWGPPTGIET